MTAKLIDPPRRVLAGLVVLLPSDLVAGPQHDGDVVCVARTYEF